MNENIANIEYLGADGTIQQLEHLYSVPMLAAGDRGKFAKWCELRYYGDDEMNVYTVAVGFSDKPVGPKPISDRDSHTFNQSEWAYRDYRRWVQWYGRDPLHLLDGGGDVPSHELRKRFKTHERKAKQLWRWIRRSALKKGHWTLEDEVEYRMFGKPWWYRSGRRLYAKWSVVLPNGQIITMRQEHGKP